MTSFLGFIIAVIALAIMLFFGYLLENWRFLVWKNKGRVFRIRKEILDFSNQINDPTRQIESKKLETKRIDYDKD